MHQHQQGSEFVVGVDHHFVEEARQLTVRLKRRSAWVEAVAGALIVGLAVALMVMATPEGFWSWMIVGVSGISALLLLGSSCRRFADVRRLRRSWSATGIPATALRMSDLGLRCSIDDAPDGVFLPWSAIEGFRIRPCRAQQLLVLELAPGVNASTPGVTGLDRPAVQRVMQRKVSGVKGLRFPVAALDQSLQDIDRALARLTEGRVRIRT